jgi:UDPglucose--hexose-1-phosphate uridylyltransferase
MQPKRSSLVQAIPHRRYNALMGDWVFVSPHRNQRPWQGRTESTIPPARLAYDPACYLCPGNARANGHANPTYASTYVFQNDFPAFLEKPASLGASLNPGSDLLLSHAQAGECRVLCYSPRHDLDLAQMDCEAIGEVIQTWTQQAAELGARWDWVQIFENRGELMGCSNPHPHGQIWASDCVPSLVEREWRQQESWVKANGSPLLLDYAGLEAYEGERVVVQDEHWLVVVPWWAAWPFETLLLPRRHIRHFPDLNASERTSLASVLKQLLQTYDRLFDCPFPYSFGWHAAPSGRSAGGGISDAWQLHAHFYPPLLRSASVRKFMVGYELLAATQRDLTPEQAAEQLRASS